MGGSAKDVDGIGARAYRSPPDAPARRRAPGHAMPVACATATIPRMMRTITPILGNSQKLDGGSMYGNCPRAVWAKWSPPDAADRIDLACRAMLVREPKRNVLLETGIGAFFEPELRKRYGVVEDRHVLLESLAK